MFPVKLSLSTALSELGRWLMEMTLVNGNEDSRALPLNHREPLMHLAWLVGCVFTACSQQLANCPNVIR
jgi:hypothetical protein